jgi:predicted PurR-regulated permease PerM
MIIYCSMMMKYTSLLLLSVLSVLFVPIIQNAHAQSNPLDQLIGGIKNLTSGAGKASNNTASQAGQSAQNATSQAGQSANQSAQKAGQSFQDINRNAASYPGNASDAGNNNISKNNPIGGALQNATKGIGDTVGKLLNMGNNTAK